MTRMTNDIADTITKRIVDYTYKTKIEAAEALAKSTADEFHAALYRNFAKAMDMLPKGAFNHSSSMDIYTLLGKKTVRFSEEKPLFYNHQTYNGGYRLSTTRSEIDEVAKTAKHLVDPKDVAAYAALDAMEAHEALKKERAGKVMTLYEQIRAYSSLSKLVTALPTTEPFLYGIENNMVKLPVVQVAEFNAQFGLPADPKLIEATVKAHVGSAA